MVESVGGVDCVTRLLPALPGQTSLSESGPSRAITPIPMAEAELLAPVRPSKIVCVGRNYKDHAAELGNEVPKEPLLFLKPPSSLIGSGGTILRPRLSDRTDFEGELGIVIAKRCHKLSASEDVDRKSVV